MKSLKLLFILSVIYCIGAHGAESVEDVSAKSVGHSHVVVSRKPIDLSFWGRSVFGVSKEVEITSYVLPEALFLYSLYDKANGNEDIFVGLIQHNKKGLSIDECIAILKRNEQALQDAGKYIDKVYASSYKLSLGFMYGAAILGGLFGLYKSTKMIQDMYWRKRMFRDEAEYMAFAKILEMESNQLGFFGRLFKGEQSSFLQPSLFESETAYKQYMNNLKTIKVPAQYGKEEVEASLKKYNLLGAKDLSNYIALYGTTTYASTLLFAGGWYGLGEYLGAAYIASQWHKLQHEQLVKDKELCAKMLQILQRVEMLDKK